MITIDELYIGMLYGGPEGTGVISGVDPNARYVYMTDLVSQRHYKVYLNELKLDHQQDTAWALIGY